MEDSGKRTEFNTGAVRDTADGKSRPDLISPYAQMRVGEWLRLGAEKYDERNWEKGMPFSRCVASIERHLQQYKLGRTNEDHLAAIACNAQFLMHYEEMIKRGVLPIGLIDLPLYEQAAKAATIAGPVHTVDEEIPTVIEDLWVIKAIEKSSYPREQKDKIISEIREIVKTPVWNGSNASTIGGCFCWANTPQGHGYWKNIEDTLENESCYDA